MTWPDGGTTPFAGEKNTSWEGGYRVPLVARWPGVIKPGSEFNGIIAHEDWLPTLLAAAGGGDVTRSLLAGASIGGVSYKVHLDGYNMIPYFKGEVSESPRKEFMYWTDDGGLAALRYDRWKVLFMEQRAEGFDVWEEPLVTLRLPKLFDIRADPFERAHEEGLGYKKWRFDHVFLMGPAQAYAGSGSRASRTSRRARSRAASTSKPSWPRSRPTARSRPSPAPDGGGGPTAAPVWTRRVGRVREAPLARKRRRKPEPRSPGSEAAAGRAPATAWRASLATAPGPLAALLVAPASSPSRAKRSG